MKTRDQIRDIIIKAIVSPEELSNIVDTVFDLIKDKKISIYNLAHQELQTECCGIFDLIDSEGMIICNECNKKLRDEILNRTFPSHLKDYIKP